MYVTTQAKWSWSMMHAELAELWCDNAVSFTVIMSGSLYPVQLIRHWSGLTAEFSLQC